MCCLLTCLYGYCDCKVAIVFPSIAYYTLYTCQIRKRFFILVQRNSAFSKLIPNILKEKNWQFIHSFCTDKSFDPYLSQSNRNKTVTNFCRTSGGAEEEEKSQQKTTDQGSRFLYSRVADWLVNQWSECGRLAVVQITITVTFLYANYVQASNSLMATSSLDFLEGSEPFCCFLLFLNYIIPNHFNNNKNGSCCRQKFTSVDLISPSCILFITP